MRRTESYDLDRPVVYPGDLLDETTSNVNVYYCLRSIRREMRYSRVERLDSALIPRLSSAKGDNRKKRTVRCLAASGATRSFHSRKQSTFCTLSQRNHSENTRERGRSNESIAPL